MEIVLGIILILQLALVVFHVYIYKQFQEMVEFYNDDEEDFDINSPYAMSNGKFYTHKILEEERE